MGLRKTGTLALLGLALAAPALAEDSEVLNDQIQLDDLWSQIDVVHTGTIEGDAVGTSVAYGNVVSALNTDGALDFDSTQQNDGYTGAATTLSANVVTGTTTASTTAYANSAIASTCCGPNDAMTLQTANGDTEAASIVDVTGSTGSLALATTASANVLTVSAWNGDIVSYAEQYANGDVTAYSDVDLCCNSDSGVIATTATGNAMAVSGYTTTAHVGEIQVTNGALIQSASNVYAVTGQNLTTSTTAAGNTSTVHNEYGFATLGQAGSEHYQENNAAIVADTIVSLDNWYGYATTTSYGVGNTALISNIASDTGLYAIQNNNNTVNATADFLGASDGNGDAFLNATAVGNAASGYICTTCGDGGIYGTTYQTNYSAITAQGSMTLGGTTGSVIGSASAIGNTATYYASTGHD